MYAYISGPFTAKSPTTVVIEAGGVGYELQISLYTYGQIESLEKARLWTQLIVRDDSHTLFGFSTQEERALFKLLISVSGIGPNTGRLILSGLTPEETRNAILQEDELTFKRVKGVGPKTAQRLILELKDKLLKTSPAFAVSLPADSEKSGRQEAIAALMTLGFQQNQIQRAMAKLAATLPEDTDTESWIKGALSELSR